MKKFENLKTRMFLILFLGLSGCGPFYQYDPYEGLASNFTVIDEVDHKKLRIPSIWDGEMSDDLKALYESDLTSFEDLPYGIYRMKSVQISHEIFSWHSLTSFSYIGCKLRRAGIFKNDEPCEFGRIKGFTRSGMGGTRELTFPLVVRVDTEGVFFDSYVQLTESVASFLPELSVESLTGDEEELRSSFYEDFYMKPEYRKGYFFDLKSGDAGSGSRNTAAITYKGDELQVIRHHYVNGNHRSQDLSGMILKYQRSE